MSQYRKERLSQLYQRQLSQLLHQNVDDERLTGIYITGVSFTADLKIAKVYFEATDGRVREKEILKGLDKCKGYLRHAMARSINLKYSPELRFYFDESNEVKEGIDHLFEQIQSESHEDSQKDLS